MTYKIIEGTITEVTTGKKLCTMHEIAQHMNGLRKTSRYVARKDNGGREYIDFVGFTAKYYGLREICELLNGCVMNDLDKIFEKHNENTNNRIGHYTIPYKVGRFHLDHTTRKGFWLEDWVTGRKYYFHVKEHINAIVGLLNDYTNEGRFTSHDSKCGRVIEDTWINEEYVLGDSHDIGFIRDFLNNHDYLKYGERELPYRRMLM